jgi:MoaA/NifB/PqqE/SkfB family radical SAM enzyme
MKKDTVLRYSRILRSTAKRIFFGVDKSLDVRHLTFELTNLCNSKCDMCHIWANKPSENILTTEQILRIFSDPKFGNLEDVILTGGEMFMRDDIPEIVEAIWNVNKRVNIICSTNGILAEKIVEVAGLIASKGIPIHYGLSIDGIGTAHEKRRRAPGNFEAIDQILIPGLSSIGRQYPGLVRMAVGMCLDEDGVAQFEPVRQYCEDRRIPFMSQLVEDFDYYLPEKKRQRHAAEDWKNIHFIKKGFEGTNRLTKKSIYSVEPKKYADLVKKLIPTVHHFRLLSVLEGRDQRYECSSMRNFFLLRYDGTVAPCLRFSDWEVGNLKDTSLEDLSISKERTAAVNEILNCEGCLNTWCTDWSMERNAFPFWREILRWLPRRVFRTKDAIH